MAVTLATVFGWWGGVSGEVVAFWGEVVLGHRELHIATASPIMCGRFIGFRSHLSWWSANPGCGRNTVEQKRHLRGGLCSASSPAVGNVYHLRM